VPVIDLLHLIDRLEELIGEARRLPIGTGSVIDRRRLLDLVDQLRAAVPAEVREAQELLARKEEALAQVDEEVALRLSRADEEVERRAGESEVAKAAEVRAEQIVGRAQSEAERLLEETRKEREEKVAEGERLAAQQMDEADRYAMELLRKLEQQLDAFTASIRSGIEALGRKPEEDTQSEDEVPEEAT
jgi:cell division septum initiation protein DivIVA